MLWVVPLVITLTGAIAYHNSLDGTFIYDDIHAVLKNPYIRSLSSSFEAPPQASLSGRPVASLSFALTYRLFSANAPPIDPVGPPPQLDPWGYHFVNIVIHLLSALALYGVVRRTLLTPLLRDRFAGESTAIAGIIALLWVIHPLTTQSVTYIIQRTESLVGLFYLLTLYCSIRAIEGQKPRVWTVLTLICCALGMATKEVMVTAPLAVILHHWMFFPDSKRSIFARNGILYIGLALTWCILIILLAQAPRSMSVGYSMKDVTPWVFIRTEAGVLLHYLWLSVWPAQLCLDYGWPPAMRPAEYVPQGLAILFLLCLTGIGLLFRRPVAFLGAWFFLILAPTSSFVPIKDMAFEQRMYLPLASVIALTVLSVRHLLRGLGQRPRAIVASILVVIAAAPLMTRTLMRNRDYRSAQHMWELVVQQRPGNARAHAALGTEYFNGGRIEDALRHYEKAVELLPRDWTYWQNLGRAANKHRLHDKAIECYQQALSINPGSFASHYDLGVIYAAIGRHADAVKAYQRALQCPDGNDYRAHFNLGNSLLALGMAREAEFHYRKARELKPDFDKALKAIELARTRAGG